MEPKLPAPNLNPEYRPGEQSFGSESLPLPPTPETGFERGEKPMEQQGEAASAAVNAPPILPSPVAIPLPPTPVADSNITQAPVQDSPSVASDDDLIEKEWVDKAKKIIAETRDDPHKREQEVGRLQTDYLRKRYGKELGSSSDGMTQ